MCGRSSSVPSKRSTRTRRMASRPPSLARRDFLPPPVTSTPQTTPHCCFVPSRRCRWAAAARPSPFGARASESRGAAGAAWHKRPVARRGPRRPPGSNRATKASLAEGRIAGEKCDLPRTAQLRQDLLVRHSRAAPIQPYLADGQAPRFEKLSLAAQRVLVEQNQPALRRPLGPAYSAARSKKLSRASLSASAITSWGTLPSHSSTMASHGKPRSTCSRTSETKILVPRNVSLP